MFRSPAGLGFLVLVLALTSTDARKKNAVIFFADDAGFMMSAYNNTVCDTPNLDKLASKAVVIKKGFTSVSSCSPSRSVLLTGMPQHQNGMYGLQGGVFHYQSFDNIQSLPLMLRANSIFTGIIGKYHVAPETVYNFDYNRTEPINQVGRNITQIKIYVKEFLDTAKENDKQFFLYLPFFDTHRGGDDVESQERVGPFLNKWGNGQPDMGFIPDWKPIEYDPKDVTVPYFLPDNIDTRKDLAAMYTTFNRMDQGIGLYMKELEDAGVLDDTLILFTADNGIPFPNAKTNLYESGMGEPMLISSPDHKENWGKSSNRLGSTMDFTPTVLSWFGVQNPNYMLNSAQAKLTGRDLLKLAANPDDPTFDSVFSSHDFHEVPMTYPMRVMRSDRYRLIHNINWGMTYPLATDVFSSPTFQGIFKRIRAGEPINWFKNLTQYFNRPEWELFDLQNDPHELNNLAYDPGHKSVFDSMNATLYEWLWDTHDPWICMPHGIHTNGSCFDMMNEKRDTGRSGPRLSLH